MCLQVLLVSPLKISLKSNYCFPSSLPCTPIWATAVASLKSCVLSCYCYPLALSTKYCQTDHLKTQTRILPFYSLKFFSGSIYMITQCKVCNLAPEDSALFLSPFPAQAILSPTLWTPATPTCFHFLGQVMLFQTQNLVIN